METRQVVFSAGTATRDIDSFIDMLRAGEIRCVADVRRFPRSRRAHFDREPFRTALLRAGIDYVFFGDELGGFRRGSYARHMLTPDFASGIARLESLALRRPTCFVCAEADPARCHRRYIADVLSSRGWRVVHLLSPKARRVHQPPLIAPVVGPAGE